MHGRMTGKVFCAAAMIVMATGLSACSIVPGWMDPTSWFSDDAPPPPDLANLPAKPGVKRDHKLADSLEADRVHAQYSAEELRGGSEPAAAPPPKDAGDGAGVIKEVEATSAATAEQQKAREAAAAAAAAAAVPKSDRSVTSLPKGKPAIAGTLPDSAVTTAPVQAPKADQKTDTKAGTKAGQDKKTEDMSRAESPVHVARAEKSVRVAETASVQARRSLMAHVDAHPVMQATEVADRKTAETAPQVSSDGFQQSSAPPLDPTVAQFVPPSVLQQYNSTASSAQQVYVTASPSVMRGNLAPVSGALNALEKKTIVYFPHDITHLNRTGAALVRRVARAFLAAGKPGQLHVIGHSSSRTANMSLKAHLALIYKKSKARAVAVTQALMRAGVPAKDILQEAVGDSQPVYYESMPKGEEGNRRVEIFLQR